MRKLDVGKDHALELRHAGYVAQTHSISAGDAWEPKGAGRDVLALSMTLEAEAPKARPVAAAVRHPVPGKPGWYRAVARLRPHFQFEGLNASMRLVADLPKKK